MSISICSYNTGLLRVQLFGCKLFEFSKHVERRATQIADTILEDAPDIICFQEIFSKRHFERIENSLRRTHPYSTNGRSFRPKFVGSGLAIFSRFEIIYTSHHWYKHQLLDEFFFAPKAYLTATIDIPHYGLVEIINTHTTAGGSRHHPESKIVDLRRAAQLSEVADFALQRDTSVFHSLLIGDLNCGPEASRGNYEELLAVGFSDLVVAAHGKECPPITWNPVNSLNVSSPHRTSPPQRIDHILSISSGTVKSFDYRLIGTAETVRVDDNFSCTPSDHYGVQLSLNRET